MNPLKRLLIAGSFVLTLALEVSAHSVWIEPGADGVLWIRFAEPDGRFEKSPGHLDSLTPPVAVTVAADPAPLAVEKRRDHFRLADGAVDRPVVCETAFAVMARGNGPARKPNFYARWQPAVPWRAEPGMTLDLVPEGEPGRVRLLFRGRPLAGKAVTLRTPDERETKLESDAEGMVRFPVDQSGPYLLTVAHHREDLPGHHAGRRYDQTSHNASLCWHQPAGN